MKIYRIKYTTANADGKISKHQEFAASDGAASKRCTEIKKAKSDTLDSKPERAAIDVPTNKAELIDWLNTNASTVA